jgi:hypothetical protein
MYPLKNSLTCAFLGFSALALTAQNLELRQSSVSKAEMLKKPVVVAPIIQTPVPVGSPISVSNLTSKQYQKKFDELTAKGYRPIKVESKRLQVIDYTDGEGPSLGYWATFQKFDHDRAWVARHGLTNQAYGQTFESLVPQGYVPTHMNVAYLNNTESYCVIFEKIPNPPAWVARHGLDHAAFAKANQEFVGQGYALHLKSSCAKSGGLVYAAMWVKK